MPNVSTTRTTTWALVLGIVWAVTAPAEAEEPTLFDIEAEPAGHARVSWLDPEEALVPPLPDSYEATRRIDDGGDASGDSNGDESGAPLRLPAPGRSGPYVPHLGGAYTGSIPYAEPVMHDCTVEEEEDPLHWRFVEEFSHALEAPHEPMATFFERVTHAEHDKTPLELESRAIGLQPIVPRPNLAFESGERFLAPGFLPQGTVTPTGEVVRPAIWVWGEYRTHYAWRENQPGGISEWANRLDLFGQLNLSGTERVLVALRPLDEQAGPFGQTRPFSSYDFRDGAWIDGTNAEIQTLFFEGDIGEIFPYLSPYDFQPTDWGFSVGRQPILAQQGLLINEDRMDMVTLTRNTLNGHGNLNLRATGLYAWGDVNRHSLPGGPRRNFDDNDAQLFGLLTESDFAWATVNADVVYVTSDSIAESMWAAGVSAIQRFHLLHQSFNNSFHVLTSIPAGTETFASGQGELLFNQFSWTPHETEDVIYLNGFWAIDQFTSPARGPLMGGPAFLSGILWAHTGLGRYGPVLSNHTDDAVGTALGYQMFFDGTRQNVTVEVGGRSDTDSRDEAAVGFGTRYQRAFGQHWIWLVEGFVSKQESRDTMTGARTEILFRF